MPCGLSSLKPWITTTKMLDKLFRFTDKSPMRALALILALVSAFSLIWSPEATARSSQLYLWQAVIFLCAVISALVHGVGFKLSGVWRWVFCAPLSYPILCAVLYYFYIARG
ncbi:cyd operon protein YbgE [Plesiomonas shigelloides]|nr:cyd operon protein YbgE [Plesiomonas shigelloides]